MQKILLVDDDPVSLHILVRYLTEAGFTSDIANDGQQAWELLSQTPAEFMAVISDRIMPKLHGLELLARMQNHPLLKQVPVILLTGVAEKAEMVEAIKAGVNDFLYKPIDQDLLVAVVKRACQIR